ncbi:MAG: hypothetical protein ACI9SF_000759 [Candidatus Nanohaloarchaea archaeon]
MTTLVPLGKDKALEKFVYGDSQPNVTYSSNTTVNNVIVGKTITIESGTTITTDNTMVYFIASEEIIVDGIIDVSHMGASGGEGGTGSFQQGYSDGDDGHKGGPGTIGRWVKGGTGGAGGPKGFGINGATDGEPGNSGNPGDDRVIIEIQ